MKYGLSLIILATQLLLASPAHAQTANPELIFGLGKFDILQNRKGSVEGRVEYRWEPKLWRFRPLIGVMGNTDKASYFYAGVGLDLYLSRMTRISATFSPGYYEERDSLNLHYPLEFKSQIELWQRVTDNFQFGAAFSHMSNASMGRRNPGVENLLLQIAFDM